LSARRLDQLPPPPLRLVFMGTPPFARAALDALLGGPDEVVGVFSRPDAARGRGLQLEAPAVKQRAAERGIPVLQPKSWKDGAATDQLRALHPDLVVVAAYGRLLPQAALDVPRFGCINVHASLLPRWRGADPITRAILAGDAETGVTIMQMVLEMDAGAILLRRATAIGADETGDRLEERLAELGGAALREALARWRAGELLAVEQDPAAVTLAPMVRKEDGAIDWQRPAAELERAIRAFTPWPGCFARRAESALRVWRAAVAAPTDGGAAAAPGTVLAVDAGGILVTTGDGALRLLEVQAPGKKRMLAADFARGARVAAGERLG
jgi:methionyl-tRNA formyltransferase